MTSRKLVGLFFKTLLFGGIAGLLSSFFIEWERYAAVMNPFDFMEILGLLLFFTGLGLVFSAVSQTGFFAYLFINQFGLGIFRSYWKTVQIVLIAFVVFDLVYFPYQEAKGSIPLYMFILMSASILVYGLIVAKIKAQQTNQTAFIPALFLMVVMTALEWVPGLRVSGYEYALLMIIPLLVCNTYQLLILHKLSQIGEAKGKVDKTPAKKAVRV
ncbi:KinB-signaling pathway activation protein [Aciduricibacillus chroicocephali]|uniref:KinB-signaling pathway activation protein n=1 Tax=Aciduricibacillus chroicocephali TaxID=3054939 RepID=A0ABY9KYT8_9BACI|nr:KinB-signaling pathway activation protein [Bacillaceae bacterium 44XB]